MFPFIHFNYLLQLSCVWVWDTIEWKRVCKTRALEYWSGFFFTAATAKCAFGCYNIYRKNHHHQAISLSFSLFISLSFFRYLYLPQLFGAFTGAWEPFLVHLASCIEKKRVKSVLRMSFPPFFTRCERSHLPSAEQKLHQIQFYFWAKLHLILYTANEHTETMFCVIFMRSKCVYIIPLCLFSSSSL